MVPREAQGVPGAVAGAAQEVGRYLRRGHPRVRRAEPDPDRPVRAGRDVNQYYFYLLDRDFGLCFIKFSSYPPFNVRVWLNGHEWAKRQLDHCGVAYEELDNRIDLLRDAAEITAHYVPLGTDPEP
jgi:hypothetical protein